MPFQNPETTFSACGAATCSQIKVRGINKLELHNKAKRLGFANTGMGRRFLHLALGGTKIGRDLICKAAPSVGAKMRCTLITEHKNKPPKEYMSLVVAGKPVCEEGGGQNKGYYTVDQCREGAFFCMKYGLCNTKPAAINPLCSDFSANSPGGALGYEPPPRGAFSISEADFMAANGLAPCPPDGCPTPAPTPHWRPPVGRVSESIHAQSG